MLRLRRAMRGAALWAAPFFFAAPALAGEPVEVRIADYRFAPAELTVKPGTVVRWVNAEKRVSHSIFFLGPDGFESERIFPGESWQRLFDKPGRHAYRCGPHPEMQGVVVVAE